MSIPRNFFGTKFRCQPFAEIRYGLVLEGAWSIVSQRRYWSDRTGRGKGVEKKEETRQDNFGGCKTVYPCGDLNGLGIPAEIRRV